MTSVLVVIMDGAKARFLTLDTAELSEFEAGPRLIEHEGLFSAVKELQGEDLWSSTKTGVNRGAAGQAHSYDDHRQNHVIEFERRFAQDIAAQIVRLTQTYSAQQLVLVADPQILGLMREALAAVAPKNLAIHELTKNLCHLKAHELQDYLASKDLLPAYRRI